MTVHQDWHILIFCVVAMYSCTEKQHFITYDLPDKVDYNFHIKPILADRCFKCHGPDANQRKAELRLDDAHWVLKKTLGHNSYTQRVIVPGKSAESEVYHRIFSSDASRQMPPPESNLNLSAVEKDLIKAWIDQGAGYSKHWAFLPIQKKASPARSDSSWARNIIDDYILEKIEKHGLTPREEASHETLSRRIHLDLTGLPPSPEDVDAFLLDSSGSAYERTIDRLLDADSYGERMALEWLDVARYADSHGYQDDGFRTAWPYRDWVINAFNENMPYDTFLIEQIAGDLLPDPSIDQLISTCFNRNHPQTQEGGVVDEEYRVEYVADRVNTLGKGILGLTLECARCHDHKYDPFSHKDYYGLFAFFNNNNDTGIVPYNGEAAPTVLLPTEEESQSLSAVRKQIRYFESKLATDRYLEAFEKWMTESKHQTHQAFRKLVDFNFDKEIMVQPGSLNLDNVDDFKLPSSTNSALEPSYFNKVTGNPGAIKSGGGEAPVLVSGLQGKAIQLLGDAGLRFSRDLDLDRHQPFSVSLWIRPLKHGIEGPVFNKSNGDFEGYRGWLCKLNTDGTMSFQFNHVWPDNCIDFQTTDTLAINKWTHIALVYDGSSKADGIEIYINGKKPKLVLHKDNLNKSLLHGAEGSNWSNLPFMLGVELRQSIQDMAFDELKIYRRALSRIEVSDLTMSSENRQWNRDAWLDHYLLTGWNPDYTAHLDSLTEWRRKENLIMTNIKEVMVMQEKKYRRPSYVLARGAYDAPAEAVKPSLPEALSARPGMYTDDRLGLAQWIVSPENTLTARVQANRVWKMLFGKGIVATQEDFGNQGHLPSHPELLDYLAFYFMENDWDMKALIKEIMLSATYRQSSISTPNAREKDPSNSWYSHYPAHRLTGEIIRDSALKASGLLEDRIGGPSVYPYQPEGLWESLATRNATKYIQGKGKDLYRRSLYTVWKRSSPPPSMMNFDSPDRYACVVNRQKTSTPLQSLVLMNDPQFIEAARVLAQKALLISDEDISGRIDYIFKSLTSRSLKQVEKKLLNQLFAEERLHFHNDGDARKALLKVGEYPTETRLDEADLAALTIVASTVMNYDEFVIKR